jgi:hypothetical protein
LIVERLLDRERDLNGGKYPESIALVLWGTDNIKTYGESLAQVRAAPLATRQPLGGVPEQELLPRNMLPATTTSCGPWQHHEATQQHDHIWW